MKQPDSDKNSSLLKQVCSEILILRRNELGFTQKYTAEIYGIYEREYSNPKHQKHLPSSETLANMRISLGINLNKAFDLAFEKGYVVKDKYK
ncbi:MAG: hypothetical protein Q4D26_08450 [Clostridia bacterium]|nr:hypothetical protein [Clostridia bacterium]